jgi:Helix-turn-helix domain
MIGKGHNRLSYQIQEAIVLAHLRDHGWIEPKYAWEHYGVYRLAARVYRLRKDGHDIHTTRVRNDWGNPYARYTLLKLATPKEAA